MVYIQRKTGDDKLKYELVPIKPLQYFFFYGYCFVVHGSLTWPDGTTGGIPAYTITELSSGLRVSCGVSMAEAIRDAKKKLQEVGRKKVKGLVVCAVKKYGRAN